MKKPSEDRPLTPADAVAEAWTARMKKMRETHPHLFGKQAEKADDVKTPLSKTFDEND